MLTTTMLFPGIRLQCFRDARFKQNCLSLQIVRPMAEEEAAMNALIPSILIQGTEKTRDLRAITRHLDDLYGAAISPQVRRVGDYQTTGFYCSMIDDRFAMSGDQVFAPMMDFLREILLEPLLEGDGFSPSITDSEKKNLIAAIESERNDKRVYAMSRLLKNMSGADSFGLSRLGEKQQVEQAEPAMLYRHWQHILRVSPIELFYVGSAQPETVAQLLRPLFSGLTRCYQPLPPQTGYHPAPPSHESQVMDVTQGKLCMGFLTPITLHSPEFPAMQMLNTIFGAGMTSKLFQNVRERLSLCYHIGSGYYGSKGIVTVSAGIDTAKEEQTRREILRQLDACRAGDITQEELTAAREALVASLEATHDSPSAIEGYYATAALSGMDMTPAEYIRAVQSVTAQDVAAAAGKLELHSSFFLKGGEA